ncbi:hypothetical protein [Mesorhizobium sp. NZP2077]|uniref:hypothetical protein n=1 Tax=Mesorhizobium sp. NZP2077 TaxID=2483404 RepID=UPI001557C1FA|nr:hypothetical protein [Mesorhizobium sp. NZP2077]QKD18904.1 hypothetical protein HGP13_29865 [Mesorhizobium sp. NZP2077]
MAERRIAAGTAAAISRAGLQELRRVLEPERAGRDVGLVATVSVALATGGVALSLMPAVVAIVMARGVAGRVLFSVAVAVVAMTTSVTAI